MRSPPWARSGAWRSASIPGQVPLALDERQRRAAAGGQVADLVATGRAPRARWRCRRRPRPRTRGSRRRPRPRSGCRSAKRGSSKAPSGPFHSTVPAPATTSAKAAAESGPMSRPVQPSGRSPSITLTLPRGPCPSDGGPKVPPGSRAWVSVGSRMSTPESSSARQSARCDSSRSELPDVLALGGQERVRHAAADDQRVHLGGQDLEHLELVGHLGPADHRHERPGRAARGSRPAPRPPGRSAAPPRSGRNWGGPTMEAWRAVGGAEGLVHVGVEAVDQPLHEGGVVRLLARVEAQVLGQARRRGTATRSRSRTGSISQRGSGAPAGRPRCEHGHHLGPLVLEPAAASGSAAVMRKSSATVARPRTPMCRGTLKSTRTSTRFPSTVGEVLRGAGCRAEGPSRSAADQDGQVDQAVGVAPLVVVPAEDLDQGRARR